MTEQEAKRWEQLQDKPLVTGLAYAMRLALQRTYVSPTAVVARRRFEAWCAWVRAEAQTLASGRWKPVRDVAEMVARHLE